MKFTLIDKIIECNCHDRIRAVKNLSLGEEYLADHFPGYPVMPGVLMIESMVQAASWLVRIRKNFSFSMIVLSEARNVKYGRFVVPGDTLEVDITLKDIGDDTASFKGVGLVAGQVVVAVQFELKFFNLKSRDKSLEANDMALIESARRSFSDLGVYRFYNSDTYNHKGAQI